MFPAYRRISCAGQSDSARRRLPQRATRERAAGRVLRGRPARRERPCVPARAHRPDDAFGLPTWVAYWRDRGHEFDDTDVREWDAGMTRARDGGSSTRSSTSWWPAPNPDPVGAQVIAATSASRCSASHASSTAARCLPLSLRHCSIQTGSPRSTSWRMFAIACARSAKTTSTSSTASAAVDAVRAREPPEPTPPRRAGLVVPPGLGRVQRHPLLRRDREVPERTARRRHVEVDQRDRTPVPEHDVLGEQVVVADHRSADADRPSRAPSPRPPSRRTTRPPRGTGAAARRTSPARRRVIAHAGIRRQRDVTLDEGEHLAALLVGVEVPGGAVEPARPRGGAAAPAPPAWTGAAGDGPCRPPAPPRPGCRSRRPAAPRSPSPSSSRFGARPTLPRAWEQCRRTTARGSRTPSRATGRRWCSCTASPRTATRGIRSFPRSPSGGTSSRSTCAGTASPSGARPYDPVTLATDVHDGRRASSGSTRRSWSATRSAASS